MMVNGRRLVVNRWWLAVWSRGGGDWPVVWCGTAATAAANKGSCRLGLNVVVVGFPAKEFLRLELSSAWFLYCLRAFKSWLSSSLVVPDFG
ncbi:hypothetical protein Droror1_Dr00015215 [Drosera rotundifolia]